MYSAPNRGFPQIDHSVRSARVVLEQQTTAKKLPLTGIEPLTLGLSVVLIFCVYSLIPSHLSYLGKC